MKTCTKEERVKVHLRTYVFESYSNITYCACVSAYEQKRTYVPYVFFLIDTDSVPYRTSIVHRKTNHVS